MTRSGGATHDPATPLWWATTALRVVTLLFAVGAVLVRRNDFQRQSLAWAVLGVMALWTALTSLAYARESMRVTGLVITDVLLTCGLMLASPLVLSDAQYAVADPLITTVWAAVPPLVAGVRCGCQVRCERWSAGRFGGRGDDRLRAHEVRSRRGP